MKITLFVMSVVLLFLIIWGASLYLVLFFVLCLGGGVYSKTYTPFLGCILSVIIWGVYIFSIVPVSSYLSGSVQTLSGMVTATTKRTAFVLQDTQGKERYITHKGNVQLGDQVSVKGYITLKKRFTLDWSGFLTCRQDLTMYKDQLFQSPLAGVFDYPARLSMKGYDGALSSFNVTHQGSCVSCLPWRNRSVIYLIQEVQRIWGDTQESALLLGLLVGHRGLLTKQTNDSFTQSGLVHLIAVSGGNLVLLASIFGVFLFRLPVYIRFFTVAVAMTVYGLLCGFDSSVVRALIMALLGISALFLGKPILSWRMLACTFFLMLARNPLYLLYDLGFQLSFMAVVGILLFQERYGPIWDIYMQEKKKRQKSFVRAFWSHFLVSFGAFVFTLPLLFLSMGRINLTGLLSNILIVPFVPVIQIIGGITPWIYQRIPLQDMVLFLIQSLISLSHRTEKYGISFQIEELWVKRCVIMVWGVCIYLCYRNNSTRNQISTS